MKRLLIILVIAAAVAGGIFLFIRSRENGSKTTFVTEPVQRDSVSAVVTATGSLAAVTAVQVGSEVSGVIDKIYVEHNSKVVKGQRLAQINPSTLQAQVDKAKASLAKSRSSYENAVAQANNARAAVKKAQADLLTKQATSRQYQAEVANSESSRASAQAGVYSAQANLAKAEAEYKNAKLNYERMSQLFAQDLVPRSDRDDAYTSMMTSKSSVDAAQASLQSAQASLRGSSASLESARIRYEGTKSELEAAAIQVESARDSATAAEASVKGARADVSQAEASLESAKVDLSKTSITSPIDGIVLSILVSEGQTVASQFQAPELFQLAKNLDEMQVEATVDEADIGEIKQGDTATFTVDAWPEKEFSGKVREVRKASSTTNNVVTFPVIIDTNNPDMCLMPGMTATVNINTVEHKDVLVVPTSALSFKPSDSVEVTKKTLPKEETGSNGGAVEKKTIRMLYLVDPDDADKLIGVEVYTGLTDGDRTEVISEFIKDGDQIVTGSTDKSKVRKKRESGRRNGPPF